MPDFTSTRDRDAWSTIRGFVYQVDRSIERWIQLKTGESLELERGEDIDVVCHAFGGQPVEEQRLLEQVKHLEPNVTLRSSAAVEALANAVEHRANNRELTLMFRFATTAKRGIENASPLGRVPAMDVWDSIREGKLDAPATEKALVGLREILDSTVQPEKLADETWAAFREFLRTVTDDDFIAFIRCFEWGTGALAAAHYSKTIPNLLIQHGHASDATQAEELYQRLFLAVFKLLTQPGIKRLNPQGLSEQVALPTLSQTDHDILARLRIEFAHWGQRLDAQEIALSVVAERLDNLAAEQGILSTITTGNVPPMLDIPALVEKITQRRANVGRVIELLDAGKWVAIYGPLLSGKTQFTALVARQLNRNTTWIRLRGLNVPGAVRQLDAIIIALSSGEAATDRSALYDGFCRDLGEGSILVIEDLPNFLDGDELCERLMALVRACGQNGVKFLCTSSESLPESFRLRVGESAVRVMIVPPISEDEASEILTAFEAPSKISEGGFPQFVVTLAHGNPALVVAIAAYLRRKTWQVSDEELGNLFQREHTSAINDATLARLTGTVQDAETRQFLYRLNLVGGAFFLDDARALAGVSPSIDRPRERMIELSGLWIQRDVGQRLMVSPLVQALGSEDLDVNVRRLCYRLLGERLTGKAEINQLEAMRALLYFKEAGDYNRAATVLARTLLAYFDFEGVQGNELVLSVWSDQLLPTEVDLALRVYIRSLQIALFHRAGRDITYLSNDIENLANEVSASDGWALLAVASIAVPAMVEMESAKAFALLKRCIDRFGSIRDASGNEIEFPDGLTVETFIWMPLISMAAPNQFEEWMVLVESMSADQRRRATNGRLAQNGCLAFSGKLALVESKKALGQQDWVRVLGNLVELSERAFGLGLELLWAALVRTQLMVIADYLRDLPRAIALAQTALSRASADPDVLFVITAYVGEKLVDFNQQSEAIVWLTRALDFKAEIFPELKWSALIHASIAHGSTDAQKATTYAEAAVRLAQSTENFLPAELVRSLAELTISRWAESVAASVLFETWKRAANVMFDCRDTESEDWKDLFVVFAHCTGYFAHLAATGQPLITDGLGNPYHSPERGVLLRQVTGRSTLYSEAREVMMACQMAAFAESVRDYSSARQWTSKALQMADPNRDAISLASINRSRVAYLLLDDLFSEAFDAALQSAFVRISSSVIHSAGGQAGQSEIDSRAAIGAKPNENWNRVERLAFKTAAWPAAIRICTIALTNRVKAKEAADRCIEICNRFSTDASLPQLWLRAAELFELAFTSPNSLVWRGKELGEGDGDDSHLSVLAYLLAPLDPDITLVQALGSNLVAGREMEAVVDGTPVLRDLIVAPYFWRYWEARFTGARFSFRNPSQVQSRMEEARSQSGNLDIKALLRIIADGVGAPLPRHFEHWLRPNQS